MFPVLYQINARVWLFELGHRLGRPATFDDVPDAFLAEVAARGFDWVWWLGVWQTGPVSREIAREHVGLQAEYRRALPDFAQADVAGSPFAISDYVVHVDFGGAAALGRLRERMKRHGLKLLLDFVPNHLSPDHRWVRERPEYFVHGTAEAFLHARKTIASSKRRGGRGFWRTDATLLRRVVGHGAAQLSTRRMPRGDDPGIAARRRTVRWRPLRHGHAAVAGCVSTNVGRPRPAIGRHAPGRHVVLAGGDRRDSHASAGLPVHGGGLLGPGVDAATVGVRFHVRQALVRPVARAGCVGRAGSFVGKPVVPGPAGTVPRKPRRAKGGGGVSEGTTRSGGDRHVLRAGLKFFHEGQFEGRTVKLPIQLRRRPHEAVNTELASFYTALLPLIRDEIVRDGEWGLAGLRAAWDGNGSHAAFIAMHLRKGERHWLVAVNFADHWSQCFVESPISVDEGWGRRAFEFATCCAARFTSGKRPTCSLGDCTSTSKVGASTCSR